jgi:hypothetical protein
VGLLDKFKDKAGDMVQSATDKVSDATGIDVQKGLDTLDSIQDTAEKVGDAADSVKDAKSKIFGS